MKRVIMKLYVVMCSLLLVACAGAIKGPASQVMTIDKRNILLVNSNSHVERYSEAEKSFLASFEGAVVRRIDLAEEPEPVELLQDVLKEGEYQAIYSIGAKAFGTLDYIDAEIPLVYSSVLNWRKIEDKGQHLGVATEVPLKAQLTWFKYFFPELKEIGILYSRVNESFIAEARNIARNLNFDLQMLKVNSANDLERASSELMPQVEALWLISDPVVLASPEQVKALFATAEHEQVAVLTYNELFVGMGAVLSISADLPTVGRQAAILVNNILSKRLDKGGIVYPAGSRITLNQQVLPGLSLKLNDDALDSVHEIRD